VLATDVGPEREVPLLKPERVHRGQAARDQPEKNLWYSRDVAAIAAAAHLPADQVAPYFVDAEASTTNIAAPNWPMPGLTSIHLYNHSFGYAVTWYLLALGTLLAMGVVIRHEMPSRD
jgi:surfeit locus 1 family protein